MTARRLNGSARDGLLARFFFPALLAMAALLLGCPSAHAQAVTNMTGVSNGTAVETSPPSPFPANSVLTMMLHQGGSAVFGTMTQSWPGTPYWGVIGISGTISGSTLSTTWVTLSANLPPGFVTCGAGSHALTLATSGGVTTASVPGYSCGTPHYTNTYALTLVGWQKMYGAESAGGPTYGPSLFAGSIDTATGNVLDPETDYTTAGPNALSLTRYYNGYQTLARLPAPLYYVVANAPNVSTNFDLGLTINAAGTQVIAYREDGQQLTFNLAGGTWTPDPGVDMTLASSGSTWTLTTHDDTVETYTMTIPVGAAGYGQLNSIQSRNGYTQTLAYNGSNQLSTVTDSYGRQLGFTYTGGYLTQVTTPDSLALSYTYSSSGVTPGVNDRLATVGYNTSPATSKTYNYADGSYPFASTSITDENGNTYKTWAYDAYGRATSIQVGTGANADVTTVTYNDSAGTQTVQNALGQQVTYTSAAPQGVNQVTGMARAVTASVPAATESSGYDSNGYLASLVDWNGNTTTYANDAHGDPTAIVEASGSPVARTTTIAYDATWVHLPDTITTTGVTTGFTYDGSGNPLTKTLTDTTAQSVPYPTNGQTRTWNYAWSNYLPLTVQTPSGNTTTYTFDATGALTNIQNALSQDTQVTSHTGGGLPLTVVDPNSVTTTLTYSPRNWLLTSTVSTTGGPLTTTNTYDAAGNLTEVEQPDGSYLTNAYDTAHRLTTVTDSFGNSINYALDAMGDRTASNIKNPSGTVTRGHTATYDTLGRTLTDVGGVSQTTTYAHDSNGNPTEYKVGSATLEQFYDALDRWTEQAFYFGNAYKAYDAHDRVLTAEDQNGHTTSYVYDGFGDVIQAASPDTGTAVYYYDSDANLTKKVDAAGITAQHTYDALDRVLTTAYPADTAENVSYTYDQAGAGFSFGTGRLTSLTDMAGSLTRAYDERGNLLTETRTSGATVLATGYTYDGASRILTIAYPDGSVLTYARDAMGRITAASDTPSGGSPTALASSVTYEPFGPWAGLTYGNGIAETPSWDLDYRLTALTDIGTATVQSIGYSYNVANEPTAFTDSLTSANSLTTIANNENYQLNKFIQGSYTWNLAYDDNSNRASLYTTTYGLTSGTNRLASIATTGKTTIAVTTNANGNITGFSPGFTPTYAPTYYISPGSPPAITALAYDNANRLASVSSSAGVVGAYVYDGFGQRFSKTVGSTTTLYGYGQGGSLLMETTGGTTTNYIYLNGRPLAMLTGSTFTYLHDDNLGTPRVATNASKTIVWKASYWPFGEMFSNSGSATVNLRFPGQYYDAESGFSHNGYRDYVSSLGRYLEADPIGIYDNSYDLLSGMNPYNYAGMDPMRTVDPWGLLPTSKGCDSAKNSQWICRLGLGNLKAIEERVRGYMGCGGGGAGADCGEDPGIQIQTEILQNTLGTINPAMAAGVKVIEGGASSPETPPAVTYNYRGVESDHPNFSNYQNGDIIPGDVNGTVTPEEHNDAFDDPGTHADSPYTSWTTSYDQAVSQAGPGGIVLQLPSEPQSGDTWQWVASPDNFNESEILLRGTRSGAKVIWP